MSFKDHFSSQAKAYARARPRYPAAVFEYLAALCTHTGLAVDCGAGSGQAAVGLAEHFAEVVAVEPSAAQLDQALAHPRVRYWQAPAEATGLPAGCADLVCAAQALHWFDIPRFLAEARRLLKSGGVLALMCYGDVQVPQVQSAIEGFQRQIAPYWPPERALVDEGYSSVALFGEVLPAPDLTLAVDWNLSQLLDYVGTWSAVQNYRRRRGADPLPALAEALAGQWPREQACRVNWPIRLRLARNR